MGGASRGDVAGERGRVMHLEGSDQRGGEGEIPHRSINIMEICYISGCFLF